MKKIAFIFCSLFLVIGSIILANDMSNKDNTIKKDYSSLWKIVDQKEKDDLPKSAIDEVDKILAKAITEKNTSEIIKSLIYKSRFKSEINIENETDIFAEIGSLLAKTEDINDKALLNSLLAELYKNYYQKYAYTINQRTNTQDYVPSDIKVWSKNIFKDKINHYLKESIKDEKTLLGTKPDKYAIIIELGKDSEKFFPSLYDFLANRAINISEDFYSNEVYINIEKDLKSLDYSLADIAVPAKEFTKLKFSVTNSLAPLYYISELLKSQEQRGLKESILFTELKKNDYLNRTFPSYREKYSMTILENLKKEYSSYDINVEVINKIVSQLQEVSYTYNGIVIQDDNVLNKKYNLLTEGIKNYPNYSRINILKDKLADLEQSIVYITGKETYYPSASKNFDIKYKNINKISISVSDQNKKVVWKKDLNFTPQTSYLQYDATPLTIDIDNPGTYSLEYTFTNSTNQSNKDTLIFKVSKLASFKRTIANNKYEIYVVDAKNSTPIAGAKVSFFTKEWKQNKHIYKPLQNVIYTDDKGFVETDFDTQENKYNLYYSISKDDDDVENYINLYNYYNEDEKSSENNELINIFTDRNIYRPGQTVYFKTVVSNVNNLTNNQTPIVNKQYTVELLNANYEEVSKQILFTNEFGSLAGEFIIPKVGLTGVYTIKVNNQFLAINVEQYKRPTFDITFDPIKGSYSFGDSVTVTGQVKSFSGIELQNLDLNFEVTKNLLYRFWNYPSSMTNNISSGFVKTDNNGNFSIKIKIPTEPEVKNSRIWMPNIYNYKVSATVTNASGETQNGYVSFNAGSVSMILTSNIPDKIEKNSNFNLEIKSQNLSGQPINTKGTYTIYRVLENDSIDKKVLSGNFDTGIQSNLQKEILKLNSGRYTIQLETKDEQNRLVKYNSFFILYSDNDSKPPFYSNNWLVAKKDVFDDANSAQITFGISAENITVLYEIIQGNKIYSRKQIKLNNENIHLDIPYKKEYANGIVVSFTYIIDGVSYVQTININKKTENKSLDIKWKTFRDKVRPGDKEEWSMIVNQSNGNPAYAEIMASMYDASLDMLSVKNVWSSLKYYQSGIWANTMSYNNLFGNNSSQSFIPQENYKTSDLSWDTFNWFNLDFLNPSLLYMGSARSTRLLMKSNSTNADYEAAPASMSMDMKSTNKPKESLEQPSPFSGGIDLNKPQVRSNFDETAFFYPQIKTNNKGEAIISFTVPESNTTWNFKALAYNKEFNTGLIDTTIVSQKELMVTPNLPRFFRQGDKASISTLISNLSDNTIKGKVSLEFFDPITDNNVDLGIENQSQNFNLEKSASSIATWLINVPQNIDLLGCRIVAESDRFNDGEQHAIAVLPNKMLITESMPIYLNDNDKKDFHFDALLNKKSSTLNNYRVTLEYANNPAWYAIQALPTLNNPKENNVIDNFASYYANTLGMYITKQYPKITSIIKAWKAKGGTDKTFVSQLQKNEDLKALLLEETPWIMEAKNETDQMERLSLLFNLNNINQQNNLAIQQLTNLQNEDGGWSWIKDMSSSRDITQYILYGFSELVNLGAVQYGEKEKMMQIDALKYIDQLITDDYNNIKNKDKKTSISTNELEYLFVRSAYRDIPISQETRKAERFYNTVAEQNWRNLSLYERSLLLVVAQRNGNQTLVNHIMASLREKATTDKEQGMFWANNSSKAFMSQSAITVHTFIMNAFKESKASDSEMNMMKQWLLNQKQTQQWSSTHATIDAVYALLSTGDNWFDTNSNVKIKVNKQTVDNTDSELGTGYIQKTWMGDHISQQLGNVNIEREGNGPAWGAMYWQYYEELSKIKSSENGLSVNKTLFIESDNNLYPITEKNNLKVGDKVTVRLTVKSDRDLDFVMLKDQRASCFEPLKTLSGIEYRNSLSYYQSTLDASTNYYFDHLPKGTYVFEYSVYVNRIGEYANGITTIQSMYAPQYTAHTNGIKVYVK